MNINEANASSRGLVVSALQPDGTYLHRPACFLLPTPDGFAWIEPAFYDVEPLSAPAFHRWAGQATYLGNGEWALKGELTSFDGQLSPYRSEDADLVGNALEWWLKTWLPRDGRSIAELRAQILALDPEALA